MGLTGKGFMIWKIKDCENGNADQIADMARRSGLSQVLIKVADGPYAYNYDLTTKVDRVPPVADALHKRGIQVWGWQYIYGNNPSGEAKIAISQVNKYHLDGFVIDAEGEFKVAGKDTAAKTYISQLRSGLPNTPLALCSYRWPYYHPQFPWKVFLDKCDLNMPQVYWISSHNPAAQLQRSVNEFKAMSPYRPIIPVGPTFSYSGWTPTEADHNEFYQAVKDLNLQAFNYFSWDWCRKNMPNLWNLIAAFSWPGMTTTIPDELPQKLFNALNSHEPDVVLGNYLSSAVHITSVRTIQGRTAIRAYYDYLFNAYLPLADYRLIGSTKDGNTYQFTWTATSNKKNIKDGKDTIGISGGRIAYHYSSYTLA
jgi:hypothetical protein